MKTLSCHKCSKFLGEIELGKIKKGTILLCTECHEVYKTYESLANYSKSSNMGNMNNADMPDCLKDLMNGKYK